MLPAAQGIQVDDGWNFGVAVEARWSDLDALGHVTNASFWQWCDDARVQYNMHVGLGIAGTTAQAVVVVGATGEFKAPLSYMDGGIMGCRTTRLGRASMDTEHVLWARKGKVFTARFKLVLADIETGRSVEIPPSVRARITAIDGSDIAR